MNVFLAEHQEKKFSIVNHLNSFALQVQYNNREVDTDRIQNTDLGEPKLYLFQKNLDIKEFESCNFVN